MNIGSYVQVVAVLGPWESSGEDDGDLGAYIGHVGLVVETMVLEDIGPFGLVRFPSHKAEAAGQRWVEVEALRLVSTPTRSLCDSCLHG